MAQSPEQTIKAEVEVLNQQALIAALRDLGYIATVSDEQSVGTQHSAGSTIDIGVGINAAHFSAFLLEQALEAEHLTSAKSPRDGESWGVVRLKIADAKQAKVLTQAIAAYRDKYMIAFDLDGTLVDTTASFDTTVYQLVERHSGRPLPPEELQSLRAEGGFNNNWDAACELIKRRGKTLTRAELDPEALEIYFSLAQEQETLLVDINVLAKLAKRHPLYILTGRCQFEYQPVWASRLGSSFARVYCLDDLPQCKPKPAPDSLLAMLKTHNSSSGVYVGNAYDDMWAARAAGMNAIAVTTTHAAPDLEKAGAELTYALPDKILEAFKL